MVEMNAFGMAGPCQLSSICKKYDTTTVAVKEDTTHTSGM